MTALQDLLAKVEAQEAEIAKLRVERDAAKATRLKLDRRIRNQRAELAFWNWHMTEHVWQVFRAKGIMNYADYHACVDKNRRKFWRAAELRALIAQEGEA